MPLRPVTIHWRDPVTGGVGHYSTDVNATQPHESVRAYFMQDGGRLNIGHAGQDRMVQVERVVQEE